MRRLVLLVALLAVAACGPKVNPQAPFDEDDPRAGRAIDAGVPVDAAPPVDAAAPTVRTTAVSRAVLTAVLDAGPADLLASFEVTAERPDGAFKGWRLVRFLRGARRFATLDLQPGDLLTGVNGHALESPPDLGALWDELRTATAIEATLVRQGAPFTIRADVTE
ncbi:MAG: hypothetical protein IPH44_17795 [Myxococcales bacterium]|nr:hypothetical protein [Myxococcales bacterium]MBK7196760.1 hypothetical protein [Myxococcales bacterium]MBP6848459.1 hypothetical protein [Kofleriaceae bacterium]